MPNINQPAADLMTGGQPSLSDLVVLKDEGFRTIIDLRVPGEFTDFDEAKEVQALGMTYVNLPISMGQGFSEGSAKRFDALPCASRQTCTDPLRQQRSGGGFVCLARSLCPRRLGGCGLGERRGCRHSGLEAHDQELLSKSSQ